MTDTSKNIDAGADKGADTETRDWRETLQLPQTDFPMKAGLPKREPEWLARWQTMNLYDRLREDARTRPLYILHDGPPYANGNLHIGHALNKILKDFITRSQNMMGKNALYVPGWDCHGLPIEWKIEEQYQKKDVRKDDVPVLEFRAACREFAAHWVDVQSEQFQRLGVMGDWAHPYSTMDFASEAAIVAEFHKFVMNGGLYRGSKPVMWSVVEKTALAEAEVEYKEHSSPTIFVKFPVVAQGGRAVSDGGDTLSAVIWTTTPWTIPANRAIAFSPHLAYGLYRITDDDHNEQLILCDALAGQVMQAAKAENYERVADIDPSDIICAHPFAALHKHYADFQVPLLAADFVADDTGTGLVHTAPGHGQDDYELARAHNIDIPFTINEDGVYYDHVPLFAGQRVLDEKGKMGDANQAVIKSLEEARALLAKGKLRHQYPHSWRSKAPLIFRNTPQWFISMQANNLRATALDALKEVRFVPQAGRNRIQSMVETRPDWVVSRQRSWGVPLAIFVHKEKDEVLQDDKVNARIAEAVAEQGADAWFSCPPEDFLGADYKAEDYEQVMDVLDVWFDSGTTHAFVLENREELQSPADLYLEGSDQHRGWFQSSLLESCGTRGRAPYKAVLTHGFVTDNKGHKMSKSANNIVDPLKVINQSGADIIRLWVMSSDYSEDLRIGGDIIKANTDAYRKMRNTCRFLLGNLHQFTPDERVEHNEMPELERLMRHRLFELDKAVRTAYNDFDFRKIYRLLFNFMTLDLSSFYFDIRKDCLYCDGKTSLSRRASRTILDDLFSCLTAWLAPILCFTMEEVWQARFPNDDMSVHLRQFPDMPAMWQDDALAHTWRQIINVRRVVLGALEIERREKRIGSSLEAAPHIYIEDENLRALLAERPMADMCITSQIKLMAGADPADAFRLDDVAGIGVVPARAQGQKCQRSWKILPDVGSVPHYPELSPRDAEVVQEFDARK